MIKFPYYSGNIRYSKAIGYVTLVQFIKVHREPAKHTSKLLKQIQEASKSKDIETKKLLKNKLFAFTPTVHIKIGEKRRYSNIQKWTGLMQLDFDKIPDKRTSIKLKEHLFNTYNSIVCAYLSPSGLGVKCLIKTTIPEDIEQYRALFKAVEKEMEQYSFFDSATKNAILPLFLSKDKNILSRSFDECGIWVKEDWSKTQYVRLNDEPKTNFNISDKERDYNERKTIRIVKQKINDILDNGHPQLRSACLILGSRVGAGYIYQNEAESLTEDLINANNYLQKDIKNYITTSKWAINQGVMSPKYY